MKITANEEIRSKWELQFVIFTVVNFFPMNPTVVVAANPIPTDHTSPNAPLFVEAVPAASGNVQHQEVYPTPTTNQLPSGGYGYPVNPAYPPGAVPVYPGPIGIPMPQQQNLE